MKRIFQKRPGYSFKRIAGPALIVLAATASPLFLQSSTSSASAKSANPVYIIKTNHGDIKAELFADQTPNTVRNFTELAEGKKKYQDASGAWSQKPFYDGLDFHRVIKDFMIQGGCPRGDGTGGPGYRFPNEINGHALGLDKEKAYVPGRGPHSALLIQSQDEFQRVLVQPLLRSMNVKNREDFESRRTEIQSRLNELSLLDAYRNQGYTFSTGLRSTPPMRGVLAMANSGPNSNGSQFFINVIDTPWLAGKHTVFGRVVAGMDVVDKISRLPTGTASRPLSPVTIITIRRAP